MIFKIYTDGRNEIAGKTKGLLNKKEFCVKETISIVEPAILNELEEYGYTVIVYKNKKIILAKEPANRYLMI